MRYLMFAVALAAAHPAAAADRADALAQMVGSDEKLDLVFNRLSPVFGTQVVAYMLGDKATKPMIEKVIAEGRGGRARLEAILSEEFLVEIRKSYPSMRDEMAAVYREKLTAAQIDELARFFASGAGAGFLALDVQMDARLAAAGEKTGAKAGIDALPRALERVEAEMMK